jgi:hypothetical protein
MLKLPASERNFIFVTLVLVLALGGQTVASVLREDVSETAVADVAMPSKDGRQPASLAGAKPLKTSLSQMLDLDLSCSKKMKKIFSVSGNYFQLKGKNCLKNFKQEQIQIVNQSNGYTASVFAFGHNQYQTDMIQLRDGENEITIRHQSASGSVFEQTFKVQSSSI